MGLAAAAVAVLNLPLLQESSGDTWARLCANKTLLGTRSRGQASGATTPDLAASPAAPKAPTASASPLGCTRVWSPPNSSLSSSFRPAGPQAGRGEPLCPLWGRGSPSTQPCEPTQACLPLTLPFAHSFPLWVQQRPRFCFSKATPWKPGSPVISTMTRTIALRAVSPSCAEIPPLTLF